MARNWVLHGAASYQRRPPRIIVLAADLDLYIALNTATPPFDDRLARQAFALALDRPALGRIAGAVVTPLGRILPPGIPGYELPVRDQALDADRAAS